MLGANAAMTSALTWAGTFRGIGTRLPRDYAGLSASRNGWLQSFCGNRAVPRPRVRQLAPLIEKIAALVGGFGLVALGMRQCRLIDFGWKRSLFGGPISKRRAETVHDLPQR